jgi:hypothetical protein
MPKPRMRGAEHPITPVLANSICALPVCEQFASRSIVEWTGSGSTGGTSSDLAHVCAVAMRPMRCICGAMSRWRRRKRGSGAIARNSSWSRRRKFDGGVYAGMFHVNIGRARAHSARPVPTAPSGRRRTIEMHSAVQRHQQKSGGQQGSHAAQESGRRTIRERLELHEKCGIQGPVRALQQRAHSESHTAWRRRRSVTASGPTPAP